MTKNFTQNRNTENLDITLFKCKESNVTKLVQDVKIRVTIQKMDKYEKSHTKFVDCVLKRINQ